MLATNRQKHVAHQSCGLWVDIELLDEGSASALYGGLQVTSPLDKLGILSCKVVSVKTKGGEAADFSAVLRCYRQWLLKLCDFRSVTDLLGLDASAIRSR